MKNNFKISHCLMSTSDKPHTELLSNFANPQNGEFAEITNASGVKRHFQFIENNWQLVETIVFYQINRMTSAMHNGSEKEIIKISDYATEKDAKKNVAFKVKNLKNSGYIVNVTAYLSSGKYKFIM
ncbi:hypothetical protein J2810_004573 [Chryseobacterium rhizosphaerae]|uniref:hypothetical protein n=1 Tax=Chryseobacterium rhizosphaerae TaxID=395937 RepID=UPI00285B8B49|nr:hypothetical protein [Chryseobacterium rhizosphaerae]MDR6548483.1 hypothetical protein [Chryseobacterium rhizosphaerae]